MKTPLVSVIVPVYKVEKHLRTCVNSVINQSYQNWELILVNDGSPDNCPQICDDYAASDSRIKVVHKKNEGVSIARNIGLDISVGHYVSFLDSDDFWNISYLDKMTTMATKNKADLVQCRFIVGNETTFPKTKHSKKTRTFDNHTIFLEGHANIIIWAKLFKRHLLEDIRFAENKLFEDEFFTWKCYYNSKKIVVSNEPLYYYTKNPTSTMAKHFIKPRLDFLEAYNERISFFEHTGEKDLEDYSRAQLCKSMILLSQNDNLSSEQRIIVANTFETNWEIVKSSEHIKFSLKMIFAFYRIAPQLTLKMIKLLRK